MIEHEGGLQGGEWTMQGRGPASEPLSYGEWIGRLRTDPFGAGGHGIALVVITLVALIASFVLFGPALIKALPAGRYPKLVLALPFLVGAAGVFFGLSPVFYRLYRRGAGRRAPVAAEAPAPGAPNVAPTLIVLGALVAFIAGFPLFVKHVLL